MALPATELVAHDDRHRAPRRGRTQGHRRPISDPDRVRPPAQGQDRGRLLRDRGDLHLHRDLRRPDQRALRRLHRDRPREHRDRPDDAAAEDRAAERGFTMDHPFGVAPGLGDRQPRGVDPRAARPRCSWRRWPPCSRPSIGVIARPGRRLPGRHRRLDHLLHHRPVPHLPVPASAPCALAPIINERFATDPDKLKTVSFWSLVAILVIFGWMGVARLVRGEVLSLREREFVKAARVIGVPTHRILVREMLPNLVAPIVISFSLGLPGVRRCRGGTVLPRHRRLRP